MLTFVFMHAKLGIFSRTIVKNVYFHVDFDVRAAFDFEIWLNSSIFVH